MQWSEKVKELLSELKPVHNHQVLAERLMPLIDLTSLNESDTESDMAVLFEKARTPYGHAAAVCVGMPFVHLAAAQFSASPVKVATVANFPKGTSSLEQVLIEIAQGLEAGANEIDVVFPYHRYLAGEKQYAAHSFITACRAACGNDVRLKVILETGALKDLSIIADASFDVLAAGADFIKTSTGKINEGATLEAAAVMLLVIKHIIPQLKHKAGLKISGGIKTLEQAGSYLMLAEHVLGSESVSPDTFRIGASRLVDEILGLVDN